MNKKGSAKIFMIMVVVLVIAFLLSISFWMFSGFENTSSQNTTNYNSINDSIGVIDLGQTVIDVAIPLSIIVVIAGIIIGIGVVMYKMAK